MTAHDSALHRQFDGIRQWLGFDRSAAPEHAPLPQPGNPDMHDDVARQRQDLLARIEAFHTAHSLPATRLSLGIAHDLATGARPDLASSIALRSRSLRPISQEWLEYTLGEREQGPDQTMLDELVLRLEASVATFTRTTKDARVATNDYGAALARHADDLHGISVPGAVLSDLTALTKAMLARTREVERELSRSEKESRALRERLEDTRRSAEQDHLTGLPNRRAFEALYERELQTALANGESICVAFVDVDHFKRINDDHGHESGDRILKVVADALNRISNERCHVARHGGEEFVALFRGVGLDGTWHRLDHARQDLCGRRLVNRATDVPFGEITFSGGVADVLAFPDRRTALRAADAALYRAKQCGRNRIERASAEDAALVELSST